MDSDPLENPTPPPAASNGETQTDQPLYYVLNAGAILGPFTMDALVEHIEAGEISRDQRAKRLDVTDDVDRLRVTRGKVNLPVHWTGPVDVATLVPARSKRSSRPAKTRFAVSIMTLP